ncbi:hypothetical protein [Pedobacter steynii]
MLGFENLNRRNLVNLNTNIQHGLNGSGNDEYWYRITDFKTGTILLEGSEKFPGEEEARFAMEDALSLIYSAQNLKTIDNGDGTFYYQVLNADKVIGTSTKLYSSMNEAALDLQQLVLLVTKNRAEEGMFLIEHMLLLPPQVKTINTPSTEIT